MDFFLDFHEGSDDASCQKDIENRKWKNSRTQLYDALLVVVENGEERIERNSIDLTTEKCREIAEKRWEEKSPSDSIEVAKALSRNTMSFPEEYEEESEYASEKGEMIVLWYKEELCKGEYMSSSEFHEDELFISPLCEKIPNSREEEHRNSEIYDSPIWENRSSEAFLPGKVMKKCDKQEPCKWEQNTKNIDFESEKFDRGIHVGKLGINNDYV